MTKLGDILNEGVEMLMEIEQPVGQEKVKTEPTFAQASDESLRDRKVTRTPSKTEVAIRVYFKIEGSGGMRVGNFDTQGGAEFAWIKPHSVLGLEAKPAPGHRFSHWVIQNDFAGTSRTRRVVAARGLVIKAVFTPLTNEDIRC